MVKKRKKKRRLKLKRIFILFVILLIIGLLIFLFFNQKINNIYIKGNNYLSEQEIIEYAQIDNYPRLINCSSYNIEKKLKKNKLIKEVKVYKKGIVNVYIEIEENRPLYFDSTENKTILLDKTKVNKIYNVPTLINYIPDTKTKKFFKKIKEVEQEILIRISDIEYKPNDVDKNRLLLTMNDGNYVYITINNLPDINNYINIVKEFKNKKGILYLDSGEYFKIMED